MKSENFKIPGVVKITPEIRRDERGSFVESYQKKRHSDAGIDADFLQDNLSVSKRNVLRGLHYQIDRPQGHLVTLTRGRIFDVGVDLRPHSPSFGEWVATELTSDPPVQLYLPPGVAHGFCVLSEEAVIWYKCTAYYRPGDEGGLLWNDPDLAIPWPIEKPIIAPRDAQLPLLADISEDRLPKVD